MSIIYVLKLKELDDEKVLEQLSQFISKKRRESAKRFYFLEDAKRSIGAELLIRYFLIKNYSFLNSKIDFCFNNYGKPYIKEVENLFFNVSHSNDWIVCGWSTKEIGVDIEKIRFVDLDIAKSQFCREEYEYVIEKEEESIERLMQLWTLKESFVKYIGKGLSIPFDHFLIKDKKLKYFLGSSDISDKIYLKLTSELNGYYLAECSEDPNDIKVKELFIEDLMQVFKI